MVGVPKKKHLKPYDRFLKNFQYRNALDAALSVCSQELFRHPMPYMILSCDNYMLFFSTEVLARH